MTRKPTPTKKATVQTPPKTPTLRPAKNGGLLRVGNPGNKGGTGRPRDAVRATMLEALDKRVATLERLADSDDPAVQIRAIEALAKYGLGTSNELDSRVKDERVWTRQERADRALSLLKGSKTA